MKIFIILIIEYELVFNNYIGYTFHIITEEIKISNFDYSNNLLWSRNFSLKFLEEMKVIKRNINLFLINFLRKHLMISLILLHLNSLICPINVHFDRCNAMYQSMMMAAENFC